LLCVQIIVRFSIRLTGVEADLWTKTAAKLSDLEGREVTLAELVRAGVELVIARGSLR